MSDEWNIQSPGRHCAHTGKAFEAKEAIYTILSTGPEGFRREDVCEDAWQASGGEAIRDKAGVVSFWRHLYIPPAPPPPDPLKKEDAESLLRAMLERNAPDEKEARYVLAVMLERKRIFKHRETLQGTGSVLVYEHAKTGETFTIEDPHLKLDRIAEVQKKVISLLGLDKAGAASHGTSRSNGG
ncbi:MAG: hypothetical protein JO317_04270 [Verrucomicrobiae bacterium]|nr:hypothetical protein [Verrucomicrobiae bacterium]